MHSHQHLAFAGDGQVRIRNQFQTQAVVGLLQAPHGVRQLRDGLAFLDLGRFRLGIDLHIPVAACSGAQLCRFVVRKPGCDLVCNPQIVGDSNQAHTVVDQQLAQLVVTVLLGQDINPVTMPNQRYTGGRKWRTAGAPYNQQIRVDESASVCGLHPG